MNTYNAIMDYLRDLNIITMIIRIFLAALLGGVIGLERERKRRPAGFRTHILICLGAAMTTLTSQYIVLELHLFTDLARLGAQVIAGIGFIGAGTIIVTKRRQVKGLTTAAGLWAAAIVGLCCGAGFFEGAIYTSLLILLAELWFVKLEYMLISRSKSFNVYVEYSDSEVLPVIVDTIKNCDTYIYDLELTKKVKSGTTAHSAVFSLHTSRKMSHQMLLETISKTEGVTTVEEL
jgi:putative Mg2+ transporter-C (MgtC) family protein